MELLARLLGVASLLLGFGLLLATLQRGLLSAALSAVLALGGLVAAVALGDPWPLASALVLLGQAALLPRLLPGEPGPAPTVATAAGGVVLTALAAALPLPDGFAIPLALVLLGLLGAVRGRAGVLLLLAGAQAASIPLPGPASPEAVLALAVAACLVAADGVPQWRALGWRLRR